MKVWHIGTTDTLRFDICPLMATHAIFVTRLDEDPVTWYNDRWCYEDRMTGALEAFWAWDLNWPETEPEGWVKHPDSGRYRPHGDPSQEEIL